MLNLNLVEVHQKQPQPRKEIMNIPKNGKFRLIGFTISTIGEPGAIKYLLRHFFDVTHSSEEARGVPESKKLVYVECAERTLRIINPEYNDPIRFEVRGEPQVNDGLIDIEVVGVNPENGATLIGTVRCREILQGKPAGVVFLTQVKQDP